MRYRVTFQDTRGPIDPYDVTIVDAAELTRAVGRATAGLIQGYGPMFERFERVVGQDRLLVEAEDEDTAHCADCGCEATLALLLASSSASPSSGTPLCEACVERRHPPQAAIA